MILPLAMAYVLFTWINSINSEQKVQEFFEVYSETQQIRETLSDPTLYLKGANIQPAEKLISETLSITLYDENGHVIYSPFPDSLIMNYTNKKVLYKHLYSLEQGYRAFTYKEPVYNDDTIIGFFEIKFSQNEWMTSVSNRTILVMTIFVASFIIVYLVVIWFVNRKLNIRIIRLMDEMSAFAAGEKIEEKVTRSDEIGELKRHFYSMQKQINEARKAIAKEQEMKSYMIAAISHDLKTPLTSIKAYTEMLEVEADLSREERESYERIIIEKTDYIEQMLDDLLMYTLLQSPTYDLEFVAVDGEELFDMLISDYELLCKEKDIHLHLSAHVSGQFHVSPKQLIRVADNLMSNAIKHTETGGHIWLSAHADEKAPLDLLFPFVKEKVTFNFAENVYLIVQNEGKGIEQSKLTYIFDPLYQVDQSRSKKDNYGTGLGLVITKQIVEKHGGEVSIVSEVNVGTSVICRIPKHKNIERNGYHEKKRLKLIIGLSILVIISIGCSNKVSQFSPEQVIDNALAESSGYESFYAEYEITISNKNEEIDRLTIKEWRDSERVRVEVDGVDSKSVSTYDGLQFILYDETNNQVIIEEEDSFEFTQMSMKEQAELLLELISESYETEVVGEEGIAGRNTFHLKATQKNDAALFGEQELWIDKDNWLVLKMISTSGDDVRV